MFAEIASIDLYINKNVTIRNEINSLGYKSWIHKNYLAKVLIQIYLRSLKRSKNKYPYNNFIIYK